METSGKGNEWYISFSLLNGSTSGECLPSQFVEALSVMTNTILHINDAGEMAFAVVLRLLNYLSNLD